MLRETRFRTVFWHAKQCACDDCELEQVRFSTTASRFSALWAFKKVLQNTCSERQHRVPGLFLKGAKSTTCANLTRASRFRAVSGMPNSADVTIVRLNKCVSQQQYNVSAPYGPPNKCFERHHHVSGVFSCDSCVGSIVILNN